MAALRAHRSFLSNCRNGLLHCHFVRSSSNSVLFLAHWTGEADSIPTDAIPTNAILTKIHVDRRIITLYIHIHQGATILCVM